MCFFELRDITLQELNYFARAIVNRIDIPDRFLTPFFTFSETSYSPDFQISNKIQSKNHSKMARPKRTAQQTTQDTQKSNQSQKTTKTLKSLTQTIPQKSQIDENENPSQPLEATPEKTTTAAVAPAKNVPAGQHDELDEKIYDAAVKLEKDNKTVSIITLYRELGVPKYQAVKREIIKKRIKLLMEVELLANKKYFENEDKEAGTKLGANFFPPHKAKTSLFGSLMVQAEEFKPVNELLEEMLNQTAEMLAGTTI